MIILQIILLKGLTINVATLESAVYGFAHASELKSLRKSLYPEPLPKPGHKEC